MSVIDAPSLLPSRSLLVLVLGLGTSACLSRGSRAADPDSDYEWASSGPIEGSSTRSDDATSGEESGGESDGTEGPTAPDGVNAIAPDQHPNLYFDQEEIDALREAVLVDATPAYAAEAYAAIRNTGPASFPTNLNSLPWPQNYEAGRISTHSNMKACFSYMIEPTEAKATALASALLSWTSVPNRGWSHDAQAAGHAQFALAWMYDLIYNAGVLTEEEKLSIDDFFSDISRVIAFDAEAWANSTGHSVEEEGSYRESYENWWQLDFHAGVVFALVSHDQSAVDRVFVTSVPEDFFVQDVTRFAPDTRDMKNMINGLVYPSGNNFDGYHRNYNFEGEAYHFYAVLPIALSAEAATHNGFDAWNYKDAAILRTVIAGAQWAPNSRRGDVIVNWVPFYWTVYRRFPNDPVIQSMVQRDDAFEPLPWIFDSTLPLWGALGAIQ